MDLTDTEKFKVRELLNDHVFMGILHRMNDEYTRVPIFSPQSGDDPGVQYETWVFRSGLSRGVQLAIQTLGYTHDRTSND